VIIGASSEPDAENPLDKDRKAIDKRDYPKAQRLLESISAADKTLYPRALDMLAYVYARRSRVDKAVTTYQRYTVVSQNSDTELLDWTLLHYYLADYPQYKGEVKRLLEPMLKTGHDFQEEAVGVKAALVKAGMW